MPRFDKSTPTNTMDAAKSGTRPELRRASLDSPEWDWGWDGTICSMSLFKPLFEPHVGIAPLFIHMHMALACKHKCKIACVVRGLLLTSSIVDNTASSTGQSRHHCSHCAAHTAATVVCRPGGSTEPPSWDPPALPPKTNDGTPKSNTGTSMISIGGGVSIRVGIGMGVLSPKTWQAELHLPPQIREANGLSFRIIGTSANNGPCPLSPFRNPPFPIYGALCSHSLRSKIRLAPYIKKTIIYFHT